MEEDDDEDRERGKHPGNGHNTNNANRGGGVGGGGSVSGIDSNRQQPKSKPKNYDGIPRNNVGNSEDEDEDEDDDDIEFTPGGTAPKPENKIPTASSAPPADSTQQSLSPNKALTSYLVPIVVMWLGNMF
jgi:hypothetical protein